MNDDRKNELVRLFVGAVLTAIRSERELRLIASTLEREPTIAGEVAEVLRLALPRTDVAAPKEVLGREEPPSHPLAQAAYQAIQLEKISKTQVLDDIQAVTTKFDINRLRTLSMKEILRRFFGDASVSDASKLLKRLGVNVTQDPYLRGIGDR